jgi:hypothetical protein
MTIAGKRKEQLKAEVLRKIMKLMVNMNIKENEARKKDYKENCEDSRYDKRIKLLYSLLLINSFHEQSRNNDGLIKGLIVTCDDVNKDSCRYDCQGL